MKGIMRAIALSVCLCMALAAPVWCAAQNAPAYHQHSNQIPPNILAGLDALQRGQFDETEKYWLRASRLNQDGSYSATLHSYRDNDGEYQGFDLVAAQNVTRRLRVLYLALNYQMQPHFMKIVAYKTGNDWVALELNLNISESDMEAVLASHPSPPASQ
jgi:hypothetical protein